MKYQFIEKNRGKLPIRKVCKLMGVSVSAYYKYKDGPSSNINKRDDENKKLLEEIKKEFEFCKRRVGSPVITKRLKRRGIIANRKRVARLMSENGLYAELGKKFKKTTDSNHPHPPAPNILSGFGMPEERNQVWVSDITYIWTDEGWMYLCVILDLYSRLVVGWSIEKHMKTEMILSALEMAMKRQNPERGIIFHSDRGVQYASDKFREHLRTKGIIQSMSGKGNCYDNAFAESFFHTMKNEWYHREVLQMRTLAKRDLFEYIEIYYNRERLHSGIGYITPFEKDNGIKIAA